MQSWGKGNELLLVSDMHSSNVEMLIYSIVTIEILCTLCILSDLTFLNVFLLALEHNVILLYQIDINNNKY